MNYTWSYHFQEPTVQWRILKEIIIEGSECRSETVSKTNSGRERLAHSDT